jgi:tetraacyldisaccharide-1-P 4'-kinase
MRGFCDEWKRRVAELEQQLAAAGRRLLEVSRQYDAAYAQVEQLTYQRDRARMNGDAAAHLAEYRMHRILALEAELSRLKGETP